MRSSAEASPRFESAAANTTTGAHAGAARSSDPIQARIDASPRMVAQCRLLAALGANRPTDDLARVAQLKIEANRLNVAGEEHRESGGPRRALEKEFQAEKCPGEYWTENYFLTRFEEHVVTADPPMLRALSVIFQIDAIESMPVSQGDLADKKVWLGNLSQLIDLGKNDLKRGRVSAPADAETISDMFDRLSEQQTELTKLLAAVAGQFDSRQEADKAMKSFNRQLASCKDRVRRHGGWRSPEQANQALSAGRSTTMHEAAEQEHETQVGIWKIGEAHVRDIHAMEKERHYNLVTRAEFNAEYGEWTEKRRATASTASASSSSPTDGNDSPGMKKEEQKS